MKKLLFFITSIVLTLALLTNYKASNISNPEVVSYLEVNSTLDYYLDSNLEDDIYVSIVLDPTNVKIDGFHLTVTFDENIFVYKTNRLLANFPEKDSYVFDTLENTLITYPSFSGELLISNSLTSITNKISFIELTFNFQSEVLQELQMAGSILSSSISINEEESSYTYTNESGTVVEAPILSSNELDFTFYNSNSPFNDNEYDYFIPSTLSMKYKKIAMYTFIAVFVLVMIYSIVLSFKLRNIKHHKINEFDEQLSRLKLASTSCTMYMPIPIKLETDPLTLQSIKEQIQIKEESNVELTNENEESITLLNKDGSCTTLTVFNEPNKTQKETK
jgi:hypothetical protein